jgi:CDP-diacylglycerol--glycerol-3-phosphate 3-phosphatidyltransferase
LIGDKFIKGYFKVVEPIGGWLISAGIHPNSITWAGLALTLIAAFLFAKGSFLAGGIFLVIAGTCDVLDGMVARKTDMKSKFGAFFDSTVDRYSDIMIFLGIAIFFNALYIHILILFAITGSLLTSYTRARAGAMQIDCKVGLMQRPERVTYIAAAAVFDGIIGKIFSVEHFLVIVVIWFVAIVSNITVLQRVLHVKKELSREGQLPSENINVEDN